MMWEAFDMKAWENAVIEEISFEETAYGGENVNSIDKQWNDTEGYATCGFNS